MGVKHDRHPIVLPPRAARDCSRPLFDRAHRWIPPTTITTRPASMQRADTHGWAERYRAQVRLSPQTAPPSPRTHPVLFTISFSNYTLKYVDASFYQVARGMVLPFTVGTSFFLLHARPSLRILAACAVVTGGFFVGVFLDGTKVSGLGVFFGVVSSMITALHSVVIKKSLDVVHGSALHLSWYTNLLSAVVLAPVIVVVGELPGVMKLLFGPNEAAAGEMSTLTTFVFGSIITVSAYDLPSNIRRCNIYAQGVFGFLMSVASLMSIKVTSPITHMVSSAVRGVAASLLGVWLFHDVVTQYVPRSFSSKPNSHAICPSSRIQRPCILDRDHPPRFDLVHMGEASGIAARAAELVQGCRLRARRA